MKTIGGRLLHIRKKMGFSQEKLASLIGTGRSNISRIEKGKNPPNKANIKLLEEIFGINPDWLLYGEEPMFLEKKALDTILIPVVAYIPAGHWTTWIDSFDIDKGDSYVSLPNLKNENYFGVYVREDSMEPVLYCGDILILDPNKEFKKGIAIVRHDQKYFIRIIRKLNNQKYLLMAQNPSYDDIEIKSDVFTKFFVPVKVISMRDI